MKAMMEQQKEELTGSHEKPSFIDGGQSYQAATPFDFQAWDAGMEKLQMATSFLRSWSAHPSQFDSVSPADRQNMFLAVLEMAEAAKRELGRLPPSC